MTTKISQKSKQKTNIKININLAEKKKRRKQRKKRTVKNVSSLPQLTMGEQILMRQATNVPRTTEQHSQGLIISQLRDQQQQIDNQAKLLNAGLNNLRLNRAVNSILEPPKVEIKPEFLRSKNDESAVSGDPKPEEEEEEEPQEDTPDEISIKKTPGKKDNKRGRLVNIRQLSKKLYGNSQKENLERAVKLINDNYADNTLEELQDEYRTEMLEEPDGRWGATQLIIALSGMKRTDEAISSGRVETERGGGGGFGSPIFKTPETRKGLIERVDEED